MTDYQHGYQAGLFAAQQMLRNAAFEHDDKRQKSRDIAESGAHDMAGRILISWANALEIMQDQAMSETRVQTSDIPE